VSSQVIAEEFILNFILKYRNYEKKSEISFLAWKVRSSLFETFFWWHQLNSVRLA